MDATRKIELTVLKNQLEAIGDQLADWLIQETEAFDKMSQKEQFSQRGKQSEGTQGLLDQIVNSIVIDVIDLNHLIGDK